jgi:4-hydroxy-tetrahydrodipicolinate reductase
MKITLHGASGKMGGVLFSLLRKLELPIVGAVAAPGTPELGRDLGEVHGAMSYGVVLQQDFSTALLGADVAIDFSSASCIASLCRAAARAKVPLVTGTTGLDDVARTALDEAAKQIAVLWAPNFSIGIHVLAEAVRMAVARLGPSFDVEIVEVHHRAKADAPSGTAVRLAKEVQDARAGLRLVHGRQGMVGARRDEELAVLAVRGGDVVGDHTVHLLGPGERLELTHRATSREVLARGAVRAAQFLVGRPPGRYGIADMLSDQ